MQNYDPKVAARVWERVQQPAPAAEEAATLLVLITETLQDAVLYQRLARKLPSHARALGQMAAQLQKSADCLKGIYLLRTGGRAKVSPALPKDLPLSPMLQKCYAQGMGRIAQYESRQADPQHGPIYRRLAEVSRNHCQKLLEILGAQ